MYACVTVRMCIDFWCGMSRAHAGGDVIKFVWPKNGARFNVGELFVHAPLYSAHGGIKRFVLTFTY